MKTYKYPITKLEPNQIFVFGSNTQGRHGKGAAKWALDNAGAVYGQAKGLQGRSYGIITKDLTKPIHPSVDKVDIIIQIATLYRKAATDLYEPNLNTEYLIAYNGKDEGGVRATYLNGYIPIQMASMFFAAAHGFGMPSNIVFEEEFAKLVQSYY